MMNFKQYLIDQGRTANTIKSYLNDIYQFTIWFVDRIEEGLTPERLTPTDVREYRAYLLAEGYKPATINRRLTAIRAYADCAIEAKLIRDNPVLARHVAEQPLAPRWLDRHEQNAFIREAERESFDDQGTRNLAIVLMLMHTGLRISELTSLIMADLQLGERSGNVAIRAGKGDKRRQVPLNAEVRQSLRQWLLVRPATLSTLFGIQPRAIQTILAELGHRAKVEVNPHRLRHTCAKNLLDAGASMPVVAALLGHGSLDTTQRYTTPGERDLQNAVKLLEN